MKKLKNFILNNLHWFILLAVAALVATFIVAGHPSENGYITLNGKDAKISEGTTKYIEDVNDAIYRIMNEDAPTDEETIREWSVLEAEGQGSYTTLDQVLARRKPDGDNDGGRGWQCSKYTAYLATGIKDYSSAHPDYGPVNGKDVASWLVRTKGWKYIDQPVKGAIGSGGFNTTYGHTVMFLEWVGNNIAMVNDANYVPLTVNTHSMNVSGYVWVVPEDYNPSPAPTPTPEPTPTPVSVDSYTVVRGDTLGEIARKLGWCNGCKLFGDDGYAQKIAEKNGIENRGLIYPNQVIVKP